MVSRQYFYCRGFCVVLRVCLCVLYLVLSQSWFWHVLLVLSLLQWLNNRNRCVAKEERRTRKPSKGVENDASTRSTNLLHWHCVTLIFDHWPHVLDPQTTGEIGIVWHWSLTTDPISLIHRPLVRLALCDIDLWPLTPSPWSTDHWCKFMLFICKFKISCSQVC